MYLPFVSTSKETISPHLSGDLDKRGARSTQKEGCGSLRGSGLRNMMGEEDAGSGEPRTNIWPIEGDL